MADYTKRSYVLPKGCKDVTDVILPDRILVRQLATLVRRKPHLILVDLMELNCFANLNEEVPFGTAAKVVRKYGYTPKRRA